MAGIIERYLPEHQFSERHRRMVAAEPGTVLAAAREVRSDEARLIVPLFFLRGLPARLQGRGRPARGRSARPMLDSFIALEADGDEVAVGLIGRFWQLTDPQAPSIGGPEQFLAFADPTFARSVFNFRVAPARGGTLLTTETRVLVPDPLARARFRRYWLVVQPGSALIRRSLLAAIARRAEARR